MESFLIDDNGVTRGPYSGLALRELASSGALKRTDHVVRKSDGLRVLADSVPNWPIAFDSSSEPALPPPITHLAEGRFARAAARIVGRYVNALLINPSERWKAIAVAALAGCVLLFGVLLGSLLGPGTSSSSNEQSAQKTAQSPAPVQTLQSPAPTAPPRNATKSREDQALEALLIGLSELGQRGPGALQPAAAQSSRQQCLACNGTGQFICTGCQNSGRVPGGNYCPCSFQHAVRPGGCRTCGGTGWR